MKKLILGTITLLSIIPGVLNAGTMGPVAEPYTWNGFYIGANAGYWWSQNDNIRAIGKPGYVTPLFPLGGANIANALANIGRGFKTNNQDGFIGGGQIGYNYQAWDSLVVGIDADIAGLTQSGRGFRRSRVVSLVDFPENYSAVVSFRNQIDYLGTVRAKLGFVASPAWMIYGMGGFAYGGVSFDGSIVADESLGTYPTVFSRSNLNKTLTGWTAGAGVEWMFSPQWSAKLEYTYYDLGSQSRRFVLSQFNNLGVDPVLWGSATIRARSQVEIGAIRVGINYHFA